MSLVALCFIVALLITLTAVGCVPDDVPVVPVEPSTPEYPFYTQNLFVPTDTSKLKNRPQDFVKILIEYAITFLDYSAMPAWSGKWSMDFSEGSSTYRTKAAISRDASDTAIAAKTEVSSFAYTAAMLNETAYYDFNGVKRSYSGDKGGRSLLASVFPTTALTDNQKGILRASWLVVPFNGDIVFGTNAGGQINEYAATVNVSKLLVNLSAFSENEPNGEAAGAIEKINAMLLTLVNMAFDKNLTEINNETVEQLPKMTADVHLVTNISGSTEILKEIYFKLKTGNKEGNLLRIYDFALSNISSDYNAKTFIGTTTDYGETDDAGYTALFDGIGRTKIKEIFGFVSAYLEGIKPLFR